MPTLRKKAKKRPPARTPQSAATFEEVQKLMARAVMRPLTPAWKMQKVWANGKPTQKHAAKFIKPNGRLTSFERLEIYNKQYWFRLTDSFYDDFPGLRGVLGDRKFRRLTLAYLSAHPSRSYTLRNLGQFLIKFLEKNPALTAPHTKTALEMARFEWAQIVAFDSLMRPVLTLEDLKGANPATLRFDLQPYMSLLTAEHALDDFVLAIRKQSAAASQASQASTEPGGMHKAPRRARLKKERVWLVVHRFENTLYYKRVTPAAFALLQALQKGATLAQAAATLARRRDVGPLPDAPTIQQWFALWINLGWFCRR